MKKIVRILCIATSVIITCRPLIAQWVETSSLNGGYFRALAVSGTNIFGGANGHGIFLSANNGSSWTKRGLDGSTINAVVVAPNGSGGTNVFVGASGGTMGEQNGVILSTDNGQTWTQVNSGLTNTFVNTLVAAPNGTGGTVLFVGTDWRERKNVNGTVFRSTDNGASWTAVYSLTQASVTALVVTGTNVFAGSDANGIIRSTNNGTTWSTANNGIPKNPLDINMYVAINAFASVGTNVFAGTSNGIYLSTNNGTSWASMSDGLTNMSVYSLCASGTNLYAGTYGGGVYCSTNNGGSWSQISTGLTFPYVYALTVSPNVNGGTNLFAGTWGGGVFLSTNNGSTWAPVNSGLVCRGVCDLTVYGSNVLVGTLGCGAFVSTDNGDSWTPINAGLTDPNVFALAVAPNTSGGVNLVAGSGGMFLSTNNGTTWVQTNANDRTVLGDVHALAVSNSGPGSTMIFAGNQAQTIQQDQVFLSTDLGWTWSQFGTNINASRFTALAVCGTDIFAGTEMGVFTTTDNGASWIQVNTGLTNFSIYGMAVVQNGAGGNTILAGTGSGIFFSTNNGASWAILENDKISNSASTLAISSKTMFAGTSDGSVWKRPLPGSIAAMKDERSSQPIRYSLSQNYPNPFNPATVISYDISGTAHVRLMLFDILGREIETLVNDYQHAGRYAVKFDATNLPSGVYFYRLETGMYQDTRKLLLLK